MVVSVAWWDAAIKNLFLEQSTGLPRFARNDGFMNKTVFP
jgi:hypothetical protein